MYLCYSCMSFKIVYCNFKTSGFWKLGVNIDTNENPISRDFCFIVYSVVIQCTMDWPGRWSHVQKLLERTGPLAHPEFEPSTEVDVFRIRPIVCQLYSLSDRQLSSPNRYSNSLTVLQLDNPTVLQSDSLITHSDIVLHCG